MHTNKIILIVLENIECFCLASWFPEKLNCFLKNGSTYMPTMVMLR